MNKNILITSALPYANGNLHLGHILEFIQTDIYVRFKREFENNCIYLSGTDAHGTPIMLKAANKSLSFDKLINNYLLSHKYDLNKFSISLDNYYTTNSYENELFARKFFRKLYEKNYILIKKINQFYDIKYNMFLPDRYVTGVCPECKSENQYGDMCEKCNYKYSSSDLLFPKSVLSNTEPCKRETEHFFFDLEQFTFFLNKWCFETITQKNILNKLKEWLDIGLKQWNISRDYPYFGFKIPGEYKKFFYVWLDAPIGYISNFLNLLLKKDLIYLFDFSKLKNFDIHHFIGKDIIYFHALFWPAILKGVNFKLFKDLHVHGFLTVNNLKMSKSTNTFIHAKSISYQVESDYLRFYLASKLGLNISDMDFNFLDFANKINSDLLGKLFNIFSRCSKIIINNYNNFLSSRLDDFVLFDEYLNIKNIINPFYLECEYNKVIFYILRYADKINLYLDNEKPWLLIKNKMTNSKAHDVCTTGINLFLILILNLKPIIPNLFDKIEFILGFKKLKLDTFLYPLLNSYIKTHGHIITRIKIDD